MVDPCLHTIVEKARLAPKALPATNSKSAEITGDALAEDVVLHRIRLNYEALADGLTTVGVLRQMLNEIGAETNGDGKVIA